MNEQRYMFTTKYNLTFISVLSNFSVLGSSLWTHLLQLREACLILSLLSQNMGEQVQPQHVTLPFFFCNTQNKSAFAKKLRTQI